MSDIKTQLLRLAHADRMKLIESLQDRFRRLATMTDLEYLRDEGVDDVCPTSLSPELRDFFGVQDSREHFSFQLGDRFGKPGSIRMNTSRYESHSTPNPWAEE